MAKWRIFKFLLHGPSVFSLGLGMSRIMKVVKSENFFIIALLLGIAIFVLVSELGGSSSDSGRNESKEFIRDFNEFLTEANQGKWNEALARLIPPLQEKLGAEKLEQIFRKNIFSNKMSQFKMYRFQKRGGAAELEGNIVCKTMEAKAGKSEFFISGVSIGR